MWYSLWLAVVALGFGVRAYPQDTTIVDVDSNDVVVVRGKKPPAATVSAVGLAPTAVTLDTGATQRFTATTRLSNGTTRPFAGRYTATGGTVDSTGLYTVGSLAGAFTVTATEAGVSAAAAVDVPVVVVLPHTKTISDSNPIHTLQGYCRETFTGACSPAPPWTWTVRNPAIVRATSDRSSVRLIPLSNGSTYVVGAASGDSDSSFVTVTGMVSATLVAVELTPSNPTIATNATQQFSATSIWSDINRAFVGTYSATGGTVNGSGLYTAGATPGAFKVIATEAAKADTSNVTLTSSGCDTVKTALQLVMQFEGPTPKSPGHYNEADASAWSNTISTPGNECPQAQRLEIRRTDPGTGSYRSEVKLHADSSNGSIALPNGTSVGGLINQEMWMGWSIFFASDFVFESSGSMKETITQTWSGCSNGRSPPWEVQLSQGTFQVYNRFGTNTTLLAGTRPLTKGTWHDFVLHIKWANNGTGLLEMWMNGTKFIDRQNVNTIWSDCTTITRLKFGPYKWSWKRDGSDNSDVSTRWYVYDNFRVTNGANGSFAVVSPR